MTRACALGTNDFEKERDTFSNFPPLYTVDWNSICLILSNRDVKRV